MSYNKWVRKFFAKNLRKLGKLCIDLFQQMGKKFFFCKNILESLASCALIYSNKYVGNLFPNRENCGILKVGRDVHYGLTTKKCLEELSKCSK